MMYRTRIHRPILIFPKTLVHYDNSPGQALGI